MLDIDDEKLPPPKPARVAAASIDPKATPGCRTRAAAAHGMSSSAAATIVQLRPPNLRTASVYGIRMKLPKAAGRVVRRNFWPASKPYSGPRNSTKTDHRLQMEKPTCSDRIEKMRLRLAMASPCSSQNVSSSGRQSSIQCDRPLGADAPAGEETVVTVPGGAPVDVAMGRTYETGVNPPSPSGDDLTTPASHGDLVRSPPSHTPAGTTCARHHKRTHNQALAFSGAGRCAGLSVGPGGQSAARR